MLLAAYIQTVYVPARIELAGQYVAMLYAVTGRFSLFLRRAARLGDLSEQTICEFLADYRRRSSSRSTNNQRQILLSLWEDAADRLLLTRPVRRRIRKLPEEVDPPEAWDEGQVTDLMREAGNQRGMVGRIVAAGWWLSLFLAIYWTSSRISSTLAVPSNCYDGHSILVRRQKNHRPQWHPLPESCCDVIDSIRPADRKLIWEHPWHPRTVWTHARTIIEAAGLPCPRTGRQLFHRLRRTTITLCASVDPGVAQRTAGHKDYATTLKHYVDPRLLSGRTAVDVLPDPLNKTTTPRLHLFG
jgi:hypothetical protein